MSRLRAHSVSAFTSRASSSAVRARGAAPSSTMQISDGRVIGVTRFTSTPTAKATRCNSRGSSGDGTSSRTTGSPKSK
jgi:hypothetical protein